MYRIVRVIFVALSLACLCNAQIYIKVINDGDSSKLASIGNYTDISKNFSSSVTDFEKLMNSLGFEGVKQFDVHKKSLQNLRNLINGGQRTTEPTSCTEALEGGKPSGVYQITMPGQAQSTFDVYCLADPNKGPAWTLVQRRQDGSVDFYRGWYDYKRGFGDLNGEFWMGLDKLHAITTYREQELWIQMEDFEGENAYARYESFAIADESAAYRLNVLGLYSGNATDSMATHRGDKFTTHDNDNDKHEKGNCALEYYGAWWYRNCHDSNLNGLYLRGKNKDGEKGHGIEWSKWHKHYSLKYVHMAIRPVV